MPEDFVGEFKGVNVAHLPCGAGFVESFLDRLGSADVARTSGGGQQ